MTDIINYEHKMCPKFLSKVRQTQKLTSIPLESEAFNSNTPLEYAEPSNCLANA